MMDGVGLDTVAFIESHYIKERGLSSAKTVDFLQKNYLDHGKLGLKSSDGGLYPPVQEHSNGPRVLVLDIGLSTAPPSMNSGEILEYTADGKFERVLFQSQAMPDGLAVDPASKRMFWTNMGIPGKNDGAVYSANLDGTDIYTVIAPGRINTPKQLTLDLVAKKVYFCDREGCRVYRCGFDGSNLETLISNCKANEGAEDWCVGIAVARNLGKFYWTQKGPSKGGKGRIFCANIKTPLGQDAASRTDVQCILGGLPEPIDLEVDEVSKLLYWTDRGEIPFGNSLNRIQLDEYGRPLTGSASAKPEILTRHLKEAIGLKLDTERGHIYLTDLGGNIYRCDLDGRRKEKIFSDDCRAFTGIAVL
ncbi:hypothetical protein TrVGV298_006154 [Trichoderma virens]|nr:hypothetical protein TrVGV298_006154 [Trichoderma virens]